MDEPKRSDAEHEQLIERVAAIEWPSNPARSVCGCRTRPPGRRVAGLGRAAMTNAVLLLACQLLESGVQKVTSSRPATTGGSGFTCSNRKAWMCSWSTPRRQERPGRPKTDKLDAVWLAKLTEKGLLRPLRARHRCGHCATTPHAHRLHVKHATGSAGETPRRRLIKISSVASHWTLSTRHDRSLMRRTRRRSGRLARRRARRTRPVEALTASSTSARELADATRADRRLNDQINTHHGSKRIARSRGARR